MVTQLAFVILDVEMDPFHVFNEIISLVGRKRALFTTEFFLFICHGVDHVVSLGFQTTTDVEIGNIDA